MADTKTAPRRVGDYNPDVETGETLDGIAGQDVEIKGVEFDRRSGKNGKYTLSVIELTDGKLYHTGSPVVAERLASLFGIPVEELNSSLDAGGASPAAPSGVFPLLANFTKVQSTNDRSRSYWTVN